MTEEACVVSAGVGLAGGPSGCLAGSPGSGWAHGARPFARSVRSVAAHREPEAARGRGGLRPQRDHGGRSSTAADEARARTGPALPVREACRGLGCGKPAIRWSSLGGSQPRTRSCSRPRRSRPRISSRRSPISATPSTISGRRRGRTRPRAMGCGSSARRTRTRRGSKSTVVMQNPRTGDVATCRPSPWGMNPWSQQDACIADHIAQGWRRANAE